MRVGPLLRVSPGVAAVALKAALLGGLYLG
jgi:hypothetical protein